MLSRNAADGAGMSAASTGYRRAVNRLVSMNTLNLPEGKTAKDMWAEEEARHQVEDTGSAEASEGEIATVAKGDETEGKVKGTIGGIERLGRMAWRQPDGRILELRKEARESGEAYEERRRRWREGKEFSWLPPATGRTNPSTP
jgi:hypothetical protein